MDPRTEKQKMLAGDLYQAFGDELFGDRQHAKRLCREFNATTGEHMAGRDGILRRLLGSCGTNAFVEPSFRCDYGYNIHVGDNFYANYDLIILDCREVRIGHNCMIAPRVSIFTATHPLDAATRVAGWEFAKPIAIGDNVWIGGHAVINPGVTIGNNAVIAAGAVVTKDVPDDVVVAGVPARVIRRLSGSFLG
jgi:maltose O-acetyltransferase